MLLSRILMALRHPGLLLCEVSDCYVPSNQLSQCWTHCKVRSCLPRLQDSHPQPSASTMRLVMTRVEAVNLSAEGIASCDMVEITNSDLAHTIFSPFFADHLCAYEAVRIILLDPQNHARGVVTIGQGGIAQTTADHRLLFAAALTTLSPAVIIAHNHPSGKLVPSRADIDWTRKACQIGELHEITVRDHLILGMNGYYSMADKGLL